MILCKFNGVVKGMSILIQRNSCKVTFIFLLRRRPNIRLNARSFLMSRMFTFNFFYQPNDTKENERIQCYCFRYIYLLQCMHLLRFLFHDREVFRRKLANIPVNTQ